MGYGALRRWAFAHRDAIPAPVRLVLRRSERALDPVAVWRYRRRSGDTRPIPPRGMRERNAVDSLDYWWTAVDEAERPLHDLLARVGRSIEDFERVLDFGCGAGKVICSLRGRGPELHGCDIHEPSIRWLERNFPDLHVLASPFDPPLPYSGETFDLIFAWSVITHFDADRQRAWMREWARIARPEGLVLATFASPAHAQRLAAEKADLAGVGERAEREGVAFVPVRERGNFTADFIGGAPVYGDTFNTPESIRELASQAGFEVLEIVPDAVWGNQHCAILRRP